MPAEPAPAALLVGDAGTPAASVDETALRNTAAEHAARGLGTNARALAGFRGGADRTLSRLAAPVGSRFGGRPDGAFDDGVEDTDTTDEAFGTLGTLDDEVAALLRATLGLDGDDVRTVRDGDGVTIDPDDAAVCAALDRQATGDEARHCRELASRLEVRLDALSADSGWLAYRFDGGELLRIGYGPVNSVHELSLAGVAALAFADDTLAGGDGSDVATMAGKLRLALGANERASGREHGSFELSIVEPVAVAGSDGTRLDVAPSTPLALEADVASGQLRAKVDIGALSLSAPADEEMGATGLSLSGLTADLAFDARSETLVATRVGLGRGPFRMTIDSAELLRVDLDDFGFRLDGDGRLALSGDLRTALSFSEVAARGGRIAFSLVAPSGTAIAPVGDETFRIDEEGSLEANLSVTVPDAVDAHEEGLALRAGDCVTDASAIGGPYAPGPVEVRLLPRVVPCPR